MFKLIIHVIMNSFATFHCSSLLLCCTGLSQKEVLAYATQVQYKAQQCRIAACLFCLGHSSTLKLSLRGWQHISGLHLRARSLSTVVQWAQVVSDELPHIPLRYDPNKYRGRYMQVQKPKRGIVLSLGCIDAAMPWMFSKLRSLQMLVSISPMIMNMYQQSSICIS